MSEDTEYKQGDFIANKYIPGSVYKVHIVGVIGAGSGAGGTGYVIRSLTHQNAYVAVDDHILNYYYRRIPEEDVPFVLLDGLEE